MEPRPGNNPGVSELLGNEYLVDITGYSPAKGLHYGWVKKVKVFVSGNDGTYGHGWRVKVKIVEEFPKSVLGEVVEYGGNFIEEYIKKETPKKVKITAMSNTDARDCVCDARMGFKGFFTLLKMAKYDPGVKKMVIPTKYVQRKEGNDFIVARPADPEDSRDPETCLFVADWLSGSFPRMEDIRKMKGIPDSLSCAIFFDGDGKKHVVNKKRGYDISYWEDWEAVEHCRNLVKPEGFRLILNGNTRSSYNERIFEAVEKLNKRSSQKALEAELLCEGLFLSERFTENI